MRQRDIFWFWLPLFLSWLLMSSEGPLISAAINRLPDEVVMLAAQGIVLSLSVTIESPIINLLATSTALVKDRRSFLLMRRFTLHWMLFLTAVTIAVAYTPLFDLIVTRGMLGGRQAEIAYWVRPGMKIMILWSAAIAWRRFLQGVLIHYGYTRRIAWGTAVRLLTSGGVAVGLALWSDWAGVVIGALALMAGVLAEAAYAHAAVQPVLRRELGPFSPAAPGKPLTYRDLFWFHLPLAATAVLTLLVQPLIAFSLGRLDQPTQSLAAWPLIFQVSLMTRALAFALPEVVIALTKEEDTYGPVRGFALRLAGISILVMTLLIFTPLLTFYLLRVQDADPAVSELARSGVRLMLFLPAITTLVSWLRGLLINKRATASVNGGMFVNLSVTAAVLVTGLILRYSGVSTAVVALNLAAAVELLFLLWRAQGVLQVNLSFLPLGRKVVPVTIKSQRD
jgi:progressive ankylosis protein